jgi:hypothetical protein
MLTLVRLIQQVRKSEFLHSIVRGCKAKALQIPLVKAALYVPYVLATRAAQYHILNLLSCLLHSLRLTLLIPNVQIPYMTTLVLLDLYLSYLATKGLVVPDSCSFHLRTSLLYSRILYSLLVCSVSLLL